MNIQQIIMTEAKPYRFWVHGDDSIYDGEMRYNDTITNDLWFLANNGLPYHFKQQEDGNMKMTPMQAVPMMALDIGDRTGTVIHEGDVIMCGEDGISETLYSVMVHKGCAVLEAYPPEDAKLDPAERILSEDFHGTSYLFEIDEMDILVVGHIFEDERLLKMRAQFIRDNSP